MKEENKVWDVIVRVIWDNSTFHNLLFILYVDKIQYYIMEVYKNEEREIILYDKRKNGKLISILLIKKDFPI